MLRTPALLLVLSSAPGFLVLGACASRSGYARASATAEKTETYRDMVVRTREQVGLASDALRALAENPGDSPRSNQETFQTYARELINLESLALLARTTYGKMDARAELFFGGWTEDAAQITDAELKQSSDARRTALKANYEKLSGGQREADQALGHFVRQLSDLRLYLEHDLTADGIASAKKTIDKALADGAALQERLSALAHTSDEARTALAPLRAQAPAAPEQRVR